MLNDINLNAMQYFEAVGRTGQVARAAQELGVSPSAVSQQIRSIEQQFGVKMFRRESRRLILTMDGEQLFRAATSALHTLRDARTTILRQRENRQLVMRVSPSFGAIWLGPRLARFLTQHPEWNMRIDATPDLTDFQTENVDLDLRYGAGDWQGHFIDNVMIDRVIAICSPGYLETLQSEAADTPGRIAAARLIDNAKGLYRWDHWLSDRGLPLRQDAIRTSFDRSQMSIEAARQGVGVSLDSITLAYDLLDRGELVPFAPEYGAKAFPSYWVVCPPRHMNRRIVKLFCNWIKVEAAAFEPKIARLMDRLGLSETV